MGIADSLVITLRAVEKYVSSIFASWASPRQAAIAQGARLTAGGELCDRCPDQRARARRVPRYAM